MIVIENFVDYKSFDCNICNKSKEYLYVDRLSEKKGFLDLLDATIEIKPRGFNPIINVLGAPDNENSKIKIETKIKKLNLEKNFVLQWEYRWDFQN